MAHKRGGLAGLYDRNKKIINPVAELALGLVPGAGPALAAGYGAAVGGFDHPGQGGIKLDAGKAVLGGAQGYMLGKAGSSVGGALSKAGGVKAALTTGAGLKSLAASALPQLARSGGRMGDAIQQGVNASTGFDPDTGNPYAGAQPSPPGTPGWLDMAKQALPALAKLATGNNGMNALAAAQGLNAANLGRQSTEYAKRAMDTTMKEWQSRAPLRAQGITGMQAPPVSLPQLAAMNKAGNPFGGVG